MNLLRLARLLAELLFGLLLIGIASPLRAAQPGTHPPAVEIVAAPDLEPAQRLVLDALAAALRTALPLESEVRLQPETGPEPIPLVIIATPCDGAICLAFSITPPHAATLLSPDLEATIAAAWPLSLPLNGTVDPVLPAIVETTAGLFSYAIGDCTALPAFERAQFTLASAVGVQHGTILAFYQGLCLHSQHDYSAALNMLAGPDRAALIRAGAPWPLRLLWDAYIADSHAQSFAFDRALAWDTRGIALAAAFSTDDDPVTARLLPELYLLRGRHRLYLYEWDRVLADFDAALALPEVPARAYYDRGLLYYTQNVRQAAYDDLMRFLALEPDPDSHLIPLARRYAAELEALLATPAVP